MGHRGRRLLFPLVGVVWPTNCFACSRPLGLSQHQGACSECWTGLQPLAPPICPGCALPRPPWTDLLGPARGRCSRCVARRSPLDAVAGAVVYDALARRFLLRGKLGLRRELFGAFGRHLAAALRRSNSGTPSLLVPVPSHPWIAIRRGFNPAAEVARPISRQLGVPLRGDLLARRWVARGMTKRLGAAERYAAAVGAFRVRGRPPQTAVVTLVDDVMTTGATLEACARALLEAGAREVRAAVWARTLPPGSNHEDATYHGKL